jgi:hypothetical protein
LQTIASIVAALFQPVLADVIAAILGPLLTAVETVGLTGCGILAHLAGCVGVNIYSSATGVNVDTTACAGIDLNLSSVHLHPCTSTCVLCDGGRGETNRSSNR